jgi:hypothetical protein
MPHAVVVPRATTLLCPVVAVGLAISGQDAAGDEVRMYVRTAMYRILEKAFDEAGVGWADCHHEGRGDAVFVAIPPTTPAQVLLDQLVICLCSGLRLYNKMSSELARIRFRMAVHVGQVSFSYTGMTGFVLTRLSDLLDAPEFVSQFAETTAEFGLVASDYLYDEVIQYGPGLIEPTIYQPIKVPSGQAHACGWTYFPAGSALS